MVHLKQSGNLLFGTTRTAKMFTFLNENLFLWVKTFPKKVNALFIKGEDSVFFWMVEMVKCFPNIPKWGKCSYLINSWLWAPSLVKFQAIGFSDRLSILAVGELDIWKHSQIIMLMWRKLPRYLRQTLIYMHDFYILLTKQNLSALFFSTICLFLWDGELRFWGNSYLIHIYWASTV